VFSGRYAVWKFLRRLCSAVSRAHRHVLRVRLVPVIQLRPTEAAFWVNTQIDHLLQDFEGCGSFPGLGARFI